MKLDLKSTVIGILIGSIGLTTAYGSEKLKNISVSYNIKNVNIQDKDVAFSEGNEPFNYNGVTYAPIRVIAEALGSEIYYNQNDSSVSIYSTDSAKVRMLEDAMKNLGTVSPEKAIEVWSKGLTDRSAALQYSVMTESLKEIYLKSLNDNGYDFWVTGVSSPWVKDYEITNKTELSDSSYKYEIKYNTETSDGSYNFSVSLTLVKDGDYWKISDVNGDKDSEAYTGFIK
ncbi:hypothetical protein SDC9_150894 [bioreactor metagenome]|uniref:Copper amine oxidase-like N-terminal domain-containing protein n=1 Tax=bioreactor metagenome TaxID=1076179 RepID=A0A645EQX6_9ZZZZ|nr:stalk domain-containing protein [Candidatus Metalachnospira sp.]